MVFYEPDLELMLTTDLLQSNGPGSALPWYTSTAGGVANYLKSLNKIKNFSVQHALPSHGGIENTFAGMVNHTRNVILEREETIVALLRMGPKTCEQLDNELFRPLVLELCPWYSTVTESHLLELEKEGTIKKDGLRFIPISLGGFHDREGF